MPRTTFACATARVVLGCAVVFLVCLTGTTAGAEKVRVYPFGESDPGAMIGQTTDVTEDVQMPPTQDADGNPVFDGQGDFVPLEAIDISTSPGYVEGRGGPGSFALDFDGVDDELTSPPFDPRDFSTFASLSQAWIKPDSAKSGSEQFVWSLGNDNGGVGITADGFWSFIAASIIPDTASNTPVQFDEWQHVAVFRGGNGASLYVNGVLTATGAGFWNGVGDVTVGNRTPAPDPALDSYFDGAIDDFAISGFSDLAFSVAGDIDFFEDLVLTGVQGDVNQDGAATEADYLIWSDNVGFDNGLGAGDPGTLVIGDLDQNGRVDAFDFQEIVAGVAAGPAALNAIGVPEPPAWLLLLLGTAGATAVRRRPNRTVFIALWLSVGLLFFAPFELRANVIVADDFLYHQPTKSLGEGGGFNFQDYDGGQNGAAGAWTGRWVSVGDAVITGPDHTEPYVDGATAVDEQLQAVTRPFFSAHFLQRGYATAGVANDQTLYFGVQMRVGVIGETPLAQMQISAPDNDENVIGMGFEGGGFSAVLGLAIDAEPGLGLTDDARYHRLVGKLEINASGDDERLTVWLDPVTEEGGPDVLSVDGDVVSGLSDLTGELRLDHVGEGGFVFWDDVAIGTAWDDVASVNVPRVNLRIDSASGNVSLVNITRTDFDLNFIQFDSPSGALNVNGWNSLADQGANGWFENNPTRNRLTESNLLGVTRLAPGQSLDLGQALRTTGVNDVVAHVGTRDGLLNLATEFVEPPRPTLQAGDANQDLKFDQIDLVQVQVAAKYLTGQAATWGEGDWDGAPGGMQGSPPAGDGVFNQVDIIAALSPGHYLTGLYAAVLSDGARQDEQTSIIYDPRTGELAVDAPASTELTSINIDSAASIFTGDAATNLGGSFDNDADNNIFKATFGSSFGSLTFGNVAQAGLARDFLLNDLIVIGSLAGGGDLGNVDLIYVPEPSSAALVVLGVLVFGAYPWRRRPRRLSHQ